jgi:uncharacterized integral membrane protein
VSRDVGEREEEGRERGRERVEESRFDRGLRFGHRVGLYASLVVALAAGLFLILLIARNSHRVKVDYVFGEAFTHLVWLIVISAVVGWVLGIVTAFLIRRRTRWPGRE